MSAFHRCQISVVLGCLFTLLCLPAVAQDAEADTQWADFNHYVLIARPDLAKAAAQSLLQRDADTLLAAVESGDYKNYDRTFIRAAKIDDLREVSLKLEQKVQAARIKKSRNPDRITHDIHLLDQGQRPYRNAVQRLVAAGQFAAPQLLATLLDAKQKKLHPYVMTAMVSVGRPMTTPLAIALPQLDAVAQQQVSQVLAQIGYPDPLPYLKQVLETSTTDADARQALQVAYDLLSAKVQQSTDLSAAQLFAMLAQMQFQTATHTPDNFVGYDPVNGQGMVWTYSPKLGLIPIPVPGAIYGDVLAMRNAKQALQLQPNMDAALSLYLMANLRRENRLPEGQNDPSYPTTMKPANYYAMLAGPARVNDVLRVALDTADASLALDAIKVLSDIASTYALINHGSDTQPLLRALSYPDRRVRFHAAMALANVRPTEPFEGSYRVVPVLGEAVRQSDDRYALVLSISQDNLNAKMADLGDLGYHVIGGLSLADVASEVQASPGIDLIVADLNPEGISSLQVQTAGDYQLGAVPILALASPDSLTRLSQWAADQPRVSVTLNAREVSNLREAIEKATASYVGPPMDAEAKTQVAQTALTLLRELASDARGIYNVSDAQPALIQALGDDRPPIVALASDVLALIDGEQAQQALADAVLNAGIQAQIHLLNNLAQSATYHGNLLNARQLDTLTQQIRTNTGEAALAAARAYGAMGLPTSDAVTMILK